MHFKPLYLHRDYTTKIVKLLLQLKYKTTKNPDLFYNILNRLKQLVHPQFNHPIQNYSSLQKCYPFQQILQIFSNISQFILDYSPQYHGKLQHLPILTQITFNNQQKQSQLIKQIHFNKIQIVYLMCLMVLNIVPRQEYDETQQRRSKFPYMNNFRYILENQEYKTKTIMEYFKQYFKKNKKYQNNSNSQMKQQLLQHQHQQQQQKQQDPKQQVFTIQRLITFTALQELISSSWSYPMEGHIIQDNSASIQQYYTNLKIDFANKYIGGGALGSGCVQQQIMFANHPQLFITVLFCQVMKSNQSLIMIGFKQYSNNKGYGWDTEYQKQYNQEELLLNYGKNDYINRSREYIVAIDAINFNSKGKAQFQKNNIDREIIKAYTGFKCIKQQDNKPKQIKQIKQQKQQKQIKQSKQLKNKLKIITGNWGCGAFHGDIRVKFLIQWIAASLCGRQMVYCPFGARKIFQKQTEKHIIQQLNKKTVGQVYNLVIKAGIQIDKTKQGNIFQRIRQIVENNNKM